MLHDWFVEEGWITRNDAEWPENFYLLREANIGKEMWIWWRFKKVPNDNAYYRWIFDIFWHVVGGKDIEVTHNGQKYKTNYADLEFLIISKLELDYKRAWGKHPLLKHFREFFQKRMFKSELKKQKHDLYRETYRFQEMVKTYVGLRKYMPEPEGQEYWPQKGVGEKPDNF